MKRVVILLALGMALVGISPTAMSEEEHNGFGWTEEEDYQPNDDPGFWGPNEDGGDNGGNHHEEEQAHNGDESDDP